MAGGFQQNIAMAIDYGDLDRAIRNLPKKMERGVRVRALAAAGKILRRAIKAATPVASGGLRKSVMRRTKWYRYSKIAVLIVGYKWGPGSHAHLVEEGTKERTRKRIGGKFAVMGVDARSKSTGKVVGTHFMRNAFKKNKTRAMAAFTAEIPKQLAKALRAK